MRSCRAAAALFKPFGRFSERCVFDALCRAGPACCAGSPGEVFRVFLKLGLTSFGGPIAHLGYFRDELVVRRKWIDEMGYADLVALCQFLPGPASSQVGYALGLLRGGPLGRLRRGALSRCRLPFCLCCSLWEPGLSAVRLARA